MVLLQYDDGWPQHYSVDASNLAISQLYRNRTERLSTDDCLDASLNALLTFFDNFHLGRKAYGLFFGNVLVKKVMEARLI